MNNNKKVEYKCEVCGTSIDVSQTQCTFSGHRKGRCEQCEKIISLRDVVKKHWEEFRDKQSADEEGEYGEWQVHSSRDGMTFSSRELDHHDDSFEIVDRTANVKQIIEDIDRARKYLYCDIGPYFEILESTFNKENVFWADGGNLLYYVRQSLVSTVVLKLIDFLDTAENNLSKFSLKKIRNKITNDRNNVFERQKVYFVEKFHKSGNVIKTKYDIFPIDEYLSGIDDVLNEYETMIKGIKDYRDNHYAHIGELKNETESKNQLTLTNLRRIYGSLKIIYDGLIYSVAPDKYTNLFVDYNIWYGNMNQISKYWKENVVEPCKRLETGFKSQ